MWGSSSLLPSSQNTSRPLALEGVAMEKRMWSLFRSVKDLWKITMVIIFFQLSHTGQERLPHFLSCVPVTDGDFAEILSRWSQLHVSCVGFFWKHEHFTRQICENKDENAKEELKSGSDVWNIAQDRIGNGKWNLENQEIVCSVNMCDIVTLRTCSTCCYHHLQ